MSTPPFLHLPAGVRAESVVTARGGFAALVAGPGDPAAPLAVLVPGFTGSKEDFIAVLAPIAAAGIDVIGYDQRGQFETAQRHPATPPEGWTMVALAADLLSVVGASRPTGSGPVHLLGHSFGGLVARAAVLAAPAAFDSLVLLGSGPAAIPGHRGELLHTMAAGLESYGSAMVWAVTQNMDREAGIRAPSDPAVAAFLERRFMANDPAGLAAMARLLATEPDRTQELAAVGIRTLVAFGAADDGWPPEIQQKTASQLGAQVVSFPEAAHSPAAESPELTAQSLVRFWMHSQGAGQPPPAEEDL